jgi:hypothetical protein
LGVSEEEELDALCVSLKHNTVAAGAQVLENRRTKAGERCRISERTARSGFDHSGLGPKVNE